MSHGNYKISGILLLLITSLASAEQRTTNQTQQMDPTQQYMVERNYRQQGEQQELARKLERARKLLDKESNELINLQSKVDSITPSREIARLQKDLNEKIDKTISNLDNNEHAEKYKPAFKAFPNRYVSTFTKNGKAPKISENPTEEQVEEFKALLLERKNRGIIAKNAVESSIAKAKKEKSSEAFELTLGDELKRSETKPTMVSGLVRSFWPENSPVKEEAKEPLKAPGPHNGKNNNSDTKDSEATSEEKG